MSALLSAGTLILFFSLAVAASDETPVIALVGDITLCDTMVPPMNRYGPEYPFKGTEPLWQDADVLFANLESPITLRGTPFKEKKYRFRINPKYTVALPRAGFDVVCLANNHTMDYGAVGLEDTLVSLSSAGVSYCGAGRTLAEARRPAVFLVGGKRIAFLAYSHTLPVEFFAGKESAGTAYAEPWMVEEDVRKAKKENDWVIVSFHFGEEFKTVLYAQQRVLAHAAIDAGAVAVVGHHPHILQECETYKGRPIAYSIGQFVFGAYHPKVKGALLRLTLTGPETAEAEIIPLDVVNARVADQPRPLKGKARDAAVSEIQRLSVHAKMRRTEKGLAWP